MDTTVPASCCNKTRAVETIWDDQGPRLWFLAKSSASGEWQHSDIPPAIALPLLRPEDVIVLPDDHAPTMDFVHFCAELLPINIAEQVTCTQEATRDLLERCYRVVAKFNVAPVREEQTRQWTLIAPHGTGAIKSWPPQLLKSDLIVYGSGTLQKSVPQPPTSPKSPITAYPVSKPLLLTVGDMGAWQAAAATCQNQSLTLSSAAGTTLSLSLQYPHPQILRESAADPPRACCIATPASRMSLP